MYDLLADKLSEASNLHCLEDSGGGIDVKVRPQSMRPKSKDFRRTFCITRNIGNREETPIKNTKPGSYFHNRGACRHGK